MFIKQAKDLGNYNCEDGNECNDVQATNKLKINRQTPPPSIDVVYEWPRETRSQEKTIC